MRNTITHERKFRVPSLEISKCLHSGTAKARRNAKPVRDCLALRLAYDLAAMAFLMVPTIAVRMALATAEPPILPAMPPLPLGKIQWH